MGPRDRQRTNRQHPTLVPFASSPTAHVIRRCRYRCSPRFNFCSAKSTCSFSSQPDYRRTPSSATPTCLHFQLRRAISSASSEGGAHHATIAGSSEGGRRRFHLHWQNAKQSQSTPRREVSTEESTCIVPKNRAFRLTKQLRFSQRCAPSSNANCSQHRGATYSIASRPEHRPTQTPACPSPHPTIIVSQPTPTTGATHPCHQKQEKELFRPAPALCQPCNT